jgi:putative IMPACT (imprinted ancient) family translation regulator
MKKINCNYSFDLLQIVRNVVNKYNAKIFEEKYDEEVNMTIEVNS